MPYGKDKYKIWFYDEFKIDQFDKLMTDNESIIYSHLKTMTNFKINLIWFKKLRLPFKEVTKEDIISELKILGITDIDIDYIMINLKNKDLFDIVYKKFTKFSLFKLQKIDYLLELVKEYLTNTTSYNKEKLIKSKIFGFEYDNTLNNLINDTILANIKNDKIIEILEETIKKYGLKLLDLYNDPILINSNDINIILNKIKSITIENQCINDLLISLSYKNITVKKYLQDLLNQERERNISKISKTLNINITDFVFFPILINFSRKKIDHLKKNNIIYLESPTIFNRILYESSDIIYCYFPIGTDLVYNQQNKIIANLEKDKIKSFIDSKQKNIEFFFQNTQKYHDQGYAGDGGNLHCLSKQIYE
jgi:hypothetical protein